MSEQEATMMDDMAEAWESVEKPDEEEADAIQQNERESTKFTEEDPGLDDKRPADSDDGAISASEESPEIEGDEDSPPSSGAPVSWSATARESWKDIPKASQEYIAQRETEMAAGMRKNAEEAQRAGNMDQVLQPHQQYLAMNGGPGKAIKTLLDTGAGLQMGSPQQKAQIVANIISQYGVDIKALDSMLVGEAPQNSQNDQMAQMLDQRLGPINQFMQGYQQNQNFQQQQEAGVISNNLNAFATDPKNEFYNDVSMDMADILDMASKRNLEMSLGDAYERACKLHPEISKIVASREQQKQLGSRRRAASSISGTPGGPGGASPPGGMREAIDTAWETAGQL